MQKIYLLALAILTATFCTAQISVTATSGTVGPTAYTTLKGAFDAINAGTHKGVIAITVSGNTTEIATASLNATATGSSSYTAISIKPSGGAARTISGSLPNALIELAGANAVTIDGLNTGGNALTISNTDNSATSTTISFINDASNNSVKNASILGSSASPTTGTITFGTGGTQGNDNNEISSCNIGDANGSFPINAIYGLGTPGSENNSTLISNNNIYNFFNADQPTVGILISTGNTGWTISNNKFFQTASRTYTTANTHRVVQVGSGSNYSITGNTIGYASSTGTGIYTLAGAVATRFIAIDLALGTGTSSSIQNNTIAAFSFATSSGASTINGIWCAINLTSGDASIFGNTIGSTTATGSIVANPTTGGSAIIPINSSSTGTVYINSNTIGGIDLLPTGVLSGNIQSIQTTGASGTISILSNTIGNSLPNNIRIGVLGTTTGNGLIRGILNSNAGTVAIRNNTIRNLSHNSSSSTSYFRAIECQNGTAQITGNNISNVTAAGASTSISTPEGAGILASTALPGLVIDSNTVANLSVTNSTLASGPAVMGVYLSSAVTNVSVTRNKIYGLINSGNSTSATVPSLAIGIYLRDAGVAGPNMLVANNMISLGNGQTGNNTFIGIWNAVAAAGSLVTKIYYNTVNIEGTATTGAQPSFCYYRGDFTNAPTSPVVDIKNNIFTNTRSGGTGRHFAIANGYPNTSSSAGGWGINASNYNILNANSATVGYWSGDVTFAGWQAISSSEVNSYSGVAVSYVNSANDLHLVTTANAAANAKATPVTEVLNDIDKTARDAATPDIGADEFTPISVPITMEFFNGRKQNSSNLLNWKAGCSASSVRFDIERSNDGRNFITIGNFSATQARCAQPFDYADNSPLPSTNYYRLKMTEADGRIYYSAVVTIQSKETGFAIVALIPTLVRTTAALSVNSVKDSKLDIIITDMAGRTVIKQQAAIVAGSNMLTLDLSKLLAGTYQVTGFTADGQTGTIRFVKQ